MAGRGDEDVCAREATTRDEERNRAYNGQSAAAGGHGAGNGHRSRLLLPTASLSACVDMELNRRYIEVNRR
jgi:hypothetical protein